MKFLALALVFALAACGGSSPPPPVPQPPPVPYSGVIVLTMDASSWRFQYSPSMPPSPAPYGNIWAFDFPSADGVHYLLLPTAGKFVGILTATARLERSSDASLVETQPCGASAPRARIMFQRRGDTLQPGPPEAPNEFEHYRWWSLQAIDLNVDGPSAVTIAADPSQWSSVYGKNGSQAPDAWAAAADDVVAIGLTFGGCFAGHGVYAPSGTVKFIAESFSLQ